MRLSELQDKDIINLLDGKKVGKIIDVIVEADGVIHSLVIQKTKIFNMLPNSNEIEIKWDKIKTIGSDVILINLK